MATSSTSGTNTDAKNEITLLSFFDISILEAEKRANPVLNIRDYFTAYLIETRIRKKFKGCESFDYPEVSLTWKRYSEFEQYQQYLQTKYPYIVIPPLPEKKHTYTWKNPNIIIYDIIDPEFVDRRRAGLENFLHRVASHPLLSKDELLKAFLTKENGWNDTLKQDGYIQIVESKLKDLSVLPRSIAADSQFRAISHYSKQLELHVDSILKTRLKTVEEMFTIDNLHTHIGRIFSEWSVIEKNMGDSLQRAGHFIDKLAPCTVAALQDEDVIADQLKEYLFYASSLDIVYKHHTRSQHQIEDLKNSVKSRQEEKSRIQQGKTNLIVRLFGAVQTKEIRDEKIQQINQKVDEEQEKILSGEETLKSFTEKALEDFNRFQNQKDIDIQQTLSLYVMEQIKTAKQGLLTWTKIKNCIEAIP